MRILAYAKLNLTLEVLGKREDGYHEIASVLQSIDLADELSFAPAAALALEGDLAGVAPEENLVLRAARLLQRRLGEQQGARITLTKRIPVAAGLGGGSADAAATLVGLCRLWGRPCGREELAGLAAQLGSDVPFFLLGGTALAEGRGERLTPLPALPETWAVLATAPIAMPAKTATLYQALPPSARTGGAATQALVQALENGAPLRAACLFNAFEAVAAEIFPGFADFRRRLLEAGAVSVHLTGSGPTLFTIVKSRPAGLALQRRWESLGCWSAVVKTISKSYNAA